MKCGIKAAFWDYFWNILENIDYCKEKNEAIHNIITHKWHLLYFYNISDMIQWNIEGQINQLISWEHF